MSTEKYDLILEQALDDFFKGTYQTIMKSSIVKTKNPLQLDNDPKSLSHTFLGKDAGNSLW